MPDYALDAANVIRTMREKMDRDPAKWKQDWVFKWSINKQISEEQGHEIAEPISEKLKETFKLWVPPMVEFHFDQDENYRVIRTRWESTFRAVVPEEHLAFLHRYFKKMAEAKRFNYEGASFYLDDPKFYAEEIFLYEKAFNNRDLARRPVTWKFEFEGKPRDPQSAGQAIVDEFVELADVDPDDVDAGLSLLNGESGESAVATIEYKGCFTEVGLNKLHKQLRKAGKKHRLKYQGATIEKPLSVRVVDKSDIKANGGMDNTNGSTPLSIDQGIAWNNSVLKVTSKFDIKSLLSVAPKMRKYHLKKLAEIGLVAADWMPTAEQRLANQLRPKAEIVKRMMGAYVSTAWVCAPPEMVSNDEIKKYLATNGLKKRAFSKRETEWMQMKRADASEAAPQAGWVMENIWSLAWLLGYPATPNVSGEQISTETFGPIRSEFMQGFGRTFEELMAETKFRRLESVIALEDLMYCANNATRITNVMHGGLMQERRHSLTWALSPGVAWDDTDLST